MNHPTPGRLVCFGEVLGRLSTPDFVPLSDTLNLNLHFAGAEANVAVQFTTLGGEASLVSRLPQNRLADTCLEKLRGRGVSTSGVQRGGERMGLYFLEPGFGSRASVVSYDRAHSSMTTIRPGMFDWERQLAGAAWFHWSGITPALGSDCAAVCAEACAAASRLGIRVSCDINYRGALWSTEAAAAVIPPLVRGTDLCFCGANEARLILGAKASGDGDAFFANLARDVAQTHDIAQVAMLIRSGEAAHTGTLRGMFFDGQTARFSRTHDLVVVDRIGSGDSFAGALLYARQTEMEAQEAIEFATAAAVWKHTVPGDWARGDRNEIEALARGTGGGVIRR
jgi:2-dehydro-3-deoxygluconokinase